MARASEVSKVLTANDLGLTGSHQSGIAIPKNEDILSFFPFLDASIYNPDYLLSVFTPQTGQYWKLRYVYYNSRLHDQGTRNEYRLTGTTHMLRALCATVGDSILFQRTHSGDLIATVQEAEQQHKMPQSVSILSNGWRMTIIETEN